jgi:hypothetical protein
MLVWEGQGLDLQMVGFPEQPVDADTQGMSSQLAVESGAQAPESMGAVRFDVEPLESRCRIAQCVPIVANPLDYAIWAHRELQSRFIKLWRPIAER